MYHISYTNKLLEHKLYMLTCMYKFDDLTYKSKGIFYIISPNNNLKRDTPSVLKNHIVLAIEMVFTNEVV